MGSGYGWKRTMLGLVRDSQVDTMPLPGDELSFALGKARFPGGAFDASSRTQAMPVENVDDRDDDGNDYNEKEAGDDADAHHRQPCRNQ